MNYKKPHSIARHRWNGSAEILVQYCEPKWPPTVLHDNLCQKPIRVGHGLKPGYRSANLRSKSTCNMAPITLRSKRNPPRASCVTSRIRALRKQRSNFKWGDHRRKLWHQRSRPAARVGVSEQTFFMRTSWVDAPKFARQHQDGKELAQVGKLDE